MSRKTEIEVFKKQQFMNSASFTPRQRDVLGVLLKDNECYTLEQAHTILSNYRMGKVT